MPSQSTLPFASLATPVKSPESLDLEKKRAYDDGKEIESNQTPSSNRRKKKAKPNLPSPEVEEIDLDQKSDQEQDKDQDVNGEIAGPADSLQEPKDVVIVEKEGDSEEKKEITKHKKEQQLQAEKLREAKEKEKELKRLKIEEEKARKEAKKQEMEVARLEKKKKIEEEKQKKKEEAEMRKLEQEKKKLELEKQKEEKRKALEAKKIQQEQEKEQKRQKLEAEKLKKQEEKELAEKKKKEEEEKKNRAQTKIASFFKIRSDPVVSVREPEVELDEKKPKSAYASQFLPFFVKENSELFLACCLQEDDVAMKNAMFDSSISGNAASDAFDFFRSAANKFNYTPTSPRTDTATAFDLVQAINNNHSETEIMRLVQQIPRKLLSFYENARPSYSGSGSETITTVKTKYGINLSLNPFTKIDDPLLFNYSYDSDLEWNPEEDDEGEGEELDDEEMSANDMSDEEDDYADFLEEDKQMKKKILIGPLMPVIKVYSDIQDESEETKYFNSLQVEPLKLVNPIDPFWNYWCSNKQTHTAATSTAAAGTPIKVETKPDIITVSSLNSSVASTATSSSPLKTNINTVNVLTGHKKPKKVITERTHLLQALKLVHSHRDYSLQTLKEMTSRTLGNKYSYAIVDETIKKYFYKKDNKTYELKDENTITNLENIMNASTATATTTITEQRLELVAPSSTATTTITSTSTNQHISENNTENTAVNVV